MIYVYINYPNRGICIHKDIGCGQIKKNDKGKARVSVITPETFEKEKCKFQSKEYKLKSAAGYNGIWLEIDFGSLVKEKTIVLEIHKILKESNPSFKKAEISEHC